MRTRQILPVYTGDVSGVCAALYELGGLTVLHDPSGCNSTYNTHDEIRWYEQDSLIFASGLSQMDAVMGNDEKLIRDVAQTARTFSPAFIALVSSPIPFLTGTDMQGIARVLEGRTGIPAFALPTNGMHDYVYGAGLALEEIARRFPDPRSPGRTRIQGRKVNLLGVTPLDFGPQAQVDALARTLTDAGWEILSIWAMGTALSSFRRAGEADVNLVMSSVGLRSAEMLRHRFGTPYVVGTPVDTFTPCLSESMARAIRTDTCQILCMRERKTQAEGRRVTLIGEPVTMGSLAAAFSERFGVRTRLICPLKEWEGLLAPGDLAAEDEEEIRKQLMDTDIVVADPLYRPLTPPGVRFCELAHIALSGRMFLRTHFTRRPVLATDLLT